MSLENAEQLTREGIFEAIKKFSTSDIQTAVSSFIGTIGTERELLLEQLNEWDTEGLKELLTLLKKIAETGRRRKK